MPQYPRASHSYWGALLRGDYTVSDFSDTARWSLVHGDGQTRGDMERRLNRFLLRYTRMAEDRGEYQKADRVRGLTIPRWPLPEV